MADGLRAAHADVDDAARLEAAELRQRLRVAARDQSALVVVRRPEASFGVQGDGAQPTTRSRHNVAETLARWSACTRTSASARQRRGCSTRRPRPAELATRAATSAPSTRWPRRSAGCARTATRPRVARARRRGRPRARAAAAAPAAAGVLGGRRGRETVQAARRRHAPAALGSSSACSRRARRRRARARAGRAAALARARARPASDESGRGRRAPLGAAVRVRAGAAGPRWLCDCALALDAADEPEPGGGGGGRRREPRARAAPRCAARPREALEV